MKLKTLCMMICLGIVFVSCNYIKNHVSNDLVMISTAELVGSLKDQSVSIFDSNSLALYQKMHIPSALHMGTKNPDASLLPKNKEQALVFYCKNTFCGASHVTARFAIEKGYANVRVYPEGIDGWVESGHATEAAN